MITLASLITACSTCPPDGALELSDRRGRLSEGGAAQVAAAYEAMWRAMGAGDVCLDGARVIDGDESYLRGDRLLFAADDPRPEETVDWAMCDVVGRARGYDDGHLEWFGPDARHDFVTICMLGPPDGRWRAQVRAACGEDSLGDRERFLLDEVFPGALTGRLDGDLPAAEGAEVALDGLETLGEGYYDLAQAGGHLVAFWRPAEEPGVAHLLRSDLGGDWVVVWSGPWGEATRAEVVGGAEAGGVLIWEEHDAPPTLVWVDREGAVSATSIASDLLPSYGGSFSLSPARLWLPSALYREGPILSVDLANGAVEEIPLPDVEREGTDLYASRFYAVAGGVVAALTDADVEESYDTISIGVHDNILAHYEHASGAWRELTRGVSLYGAGVYDDRYLLGSVGSEAGGVLAVYDLEGDALRINDDVCLLDRYAPTLAADATVFAFDGGALRPVSLSPGG